MTTIDEAVLKAKLLINNAFNKGFVNAKHYQFSLPWIFNEYLGFLRGEKKYIEPIKYKLLSRNTIYKIYLQFVHFLNSFKIRKYDIVFIGSYSGHYKIYKELEFHLIENGLSYIYLTDKIALYNEIKSKGDNVIFININLTTKLSNYLNSKFTDSKDFESLLKETLDENMSYFLYLEKTLYRIVSIISPKIIISANELLIEHRAAIYISKLLNIKSITLQHGLISSVSKNYKEMIADLILVYGNSTKKNLLEMGVVEEKIKVVGSLLVKNNKINLKKDIEETSKINILVAMSGFGNSTSYHHHISIIKAINHVACIFSQINFNIKLHLKDSIELYKNITAKNISIISEDDLVKTKKTFIDLVNENDAMLTTTSASMFDAFMLKKPVLGVDFESEFKENEFYQNGLLLISENIAELENNIYSLSNFPEKTESIVNKAYTYIQDYYNLGCKNGTPQEKTVKQILNLIR